MSYYVLHENCGESLDLYELQNPTDEDYAKLSAIAGLTINIDDVPDELIEWLYPGDGSFRFKDCRKLNWRNAPELRGPLFKVSWAP